MDINEKIKLIAETITGYSVIVDTDNGANVEIAKTPMPCILIFIQETGEFDTKNSHYRDSVNIRIAFLNLMPKGFKESDVETNRYALKQDMVLLYHKLKYDFQFKTNVDKVKYEIVYDEYDDNLIGVVFSDNVSERVGRNLACETVDSIGTVPTEISFCDRVSECGTIISIQELLESLETQLETLSTDLSSHIGNVSNPHNVTASQVGLGNVDNTSDENKPVSTLQAAAIQIVQDDIDTHESNLSNPHNTTLEQVRSENNQINGNIDANGNQIDNLLNPVSNQQASTKNYTDTAEANAKAYADTIVQSNIKIIGDWDATSGSYPLNDESNTTPFITQWGNIIKQGWAFRVGYGQAGTVHVFDYENGDVVYALVDNPSDNPSDWGDLDHNLQQANESLRGTAKVITASIASDENTLDDERFLTGKKLWLNFWQRVLALSWTWQLKQIFTTAPRFSSVGASHYLKSDGSKDLTSVYQIPNADITTDSSHRFITDSERAKWNLGTETVYKNIQNSASVTGTTSETILSSVLIPANTYENDKVFEVDIKVNRTAVTGTGTVTVYLSLNNNLSVPSSYQQIALFSGAYRYYELRRTAYIKAANNTEIFSTSTSAGNDITATPAARSNLDIDWSVDQYLIVTIINAANGDSALTSGIIIKKT